MAGLDYTPDILESPNTNIANSHVRGYRAELELANRVAALSDEVVVKYGDKIGRSGSDVISVNRKTGNVTLWDSKYLSNSRRVPDSPTFKFGSEPYKNAIEEARNSIRDSGLSPELKNRAYENIQEGNFNLNTASAGNARNSSIIRIRNGKPVGEYNDL